jgi:hypothetical protein
MPSSGPLEYTLFFRRRTPNNPARLQLNWLVTAKLARMNSDGSLREKLGWVQEHVTSLGPHRSVPLRLDPPTEAGIYRVELVFRNGSGARLGRFGSYFRIPHPTPPNSQLRLNDVSFLPGQTVSAWAAEYGTGWISLHDTYQIEVYDGSAWSRAPISPELASLLIGYLVGPGETTAAACWQFPIPTDAPSGLYRFVVDGESMRFAGQRRLVPDAPLSLVSEFSISSP